VSVRFSCGGWMAHSYISVGPSRQRMAHMWLPRRAGSSGISWRIQPLVKRTLHRHRAGFEPQLAPPLLKRVKAYQILGEAIRARAKTPLFVIPLTLLVVLEGSISGDQRFCETVTVCRPSPHQDWGRARTAGNRFARDDKEPGPSWGKQLPGERPRETAET
jgi:hypothetical protein